MLVLTRKSGQEISIGKQGDVLDAPIIVKYLGRNAWGVAKIGIIAGGHICIRREADRPIERDSE